MVDLRYPVGRFVMPAEVTDMLRGTWINELAAAPAELRLAVAGLTPPQLATPYRPDGWTVRQVVHHLADSHMNLFLRFRFGLTEDQPAIKPFDEARWAELHDSRHGPLEPSLVMVAAIGQRWDQLLRAIHPAEFNRVYRHPVQGDVTLSWTLGMTNWHARHHIAHITGLRQRMGW